MHHKSALNPLWFGDAVESSLLSPQLAQVSEVNKFQWIIKLQNWISAQFQFVVSFCAIKYIYFYEPPYSLQSPEIKGTSCPLLLAQSTLISCGSLQTLPRAAERGSGPAECGLITADALGITPNVGSQSQEMQ